MHYSALSEMILPVQTFLKEKMGHDLVIESPQKTNKDGIYKEGEGGMGGVEDVVEQGV